MSHHPVPKRVHRLWPTEHEPVLEVEFPELRSVDRGWTAGRFEEVVGR